MAKKTSHHHQVTTAGQKITVTGPGLWLIELTKPGAEVEVRGRFLVKGKEQLAVEVVIHHQAAHTRAQTSLKAVGRDDSRVTLKGRIIVDQACPDTNSFLTERVLLLSDTARAETVPDLEIASDDVKCSHAASVSSIPEQQLFYLRSRGLSDSIARGLIVKGFLRS